MLWYIYTTYASYLSVASSKKVFRCAMNILIETNLIKNKKNVFYMSIKLSKHKLGSVNEILCSRQKVRSRLKSRSNFLSTWGKQRINLF